ncbi:hypothetical protein MUN88_10350 [Gracilibacillus caseinilyticus]|uniref:N-terminal half of MaoC dehydratase n=1 Tax=Gracilibacillus caseinilyticus TaxID=2932256 RepID=A0ABY4F2F2_9BACI|nr:hypothetical protein [Gracilibacillus caseinilyticus]UOQ50416.1 hypothetical protein MUN88_10350 [Gracilibacillus caseinilyticus]
MGKPKMKTEIVSVSITKEMVEEFESLFGKQLALPPTFPMIFYRYMDIPWQPQSPPILRKHHGTKNKELSVGETYQCQVKLEVKKQRRNTIFYTETLLVNDEHGEECARCVSYLLTGSQ